MTWDITIGNAAIDREASLEYGEWVIRVAQMELDDAPRFVNDDLTQKRNYRSMANTVAFDFFKQHLPEFPDIVPFTSIVISTGLCFMVTQARIQHEATIGEKVPGWPSLPAVQILPDGRHHLTTETEYAEAIARENVDPDLARLLWLEWWMTWALQHCEYPAIYVS